MKCFNIFKIYPFNYLKNEGKKRKKKKEKKGESRMAWEGRKGYCIIRILEGGGGTSKAPSSYFGTRSKREIANLYVE